MSKQISEIILFYSNFSKNSRFVLNRVLNDNLPIKTIPLDTKELRKKVENSSFIQIRNVPTLLISYTDKDVQLYVGKEKIMKWIEYMMSRKVPESYNEQKMPDHRNDVEDDYIVDEYKNNQEDITLEDSILDESDGDTEDTIEILTTDYGDENTQFSINNNEKRPEEKKRENVMELAKKMRKERDENVQEPSFKTSSF